MKSALFFLLALPLMIAPSFEEINSAMRAGNVDALANFMDDKVELAILDDEGMVSKAEAVKKLKAFFSSAKPSSYKPTHSGTSKGANSLYCINNMTFKGTDYRVYMYLDSKAGRSLIKEIRIDEDL